MTINNMKKGLNYLPKQHSNEPITTLQRLGSGKIGICCTEEDTVPHCGVGDERRLEWTPAERYGLECFINVGSWKDSVALEKY